jgi:hypothetical protein
VGLLGEKLLDLTRGLHSGRPGQGHFAAFLAGGFFSAAR